MIVISSKILNQLIRLPDKTGVYLLKDEDKNVIFVNLAKNLSTKVRGHFHSNKRQDIIIKSKTRSIEFIVEEDEILAAKLELDLIQKHHPPLNQRGHHLNCTDKILNAGLISVVLVR